MQEQRAHFARALQALYTSLESDPLIAGAWARAEELLGDVFGWSSTYRHPVLEVVLGVLRQHIKDPTEAVTFLARLVGHKVPDLEWAFGSRLSLYLTYLVYRSNLPGDPPDSLSAIGLYRLLPDNPIAVESDGSLTGWRDATSAHFRQFDLYRQWLCGEDSEGNPVRGPYVIPDVHDNLMSKIHDHLARGCSIRTTAELVVLDRRTVARWLEWEKREGRTGTK